MKSLCFLLLVPLVMPAPAFALTPKQIDDAVAKGLGAESEKAVPLFERAGGVKAPSDMVRDAILPVSGGGYYFHVGAHRQWIQNTVYHKNAAGEGIDREYFLNECFGHDELRVAILGDYDANAAYGVMTLRFPLPPRPVKSIALRVDGEMREPKPNEEFHEYGQGNGYAVFNAAGLKEARRVWIVVTIEGRSDELRLYLEPKVMRRLFR